MIIESSTHEMSDAGRHAFDVFVNATGFEERASALVRHKCVKADQFISLLFPQHRVIKFRENLQVMERVSATFIEDSNQFFRHDFCKLAQQIVDQKGRKIKIGVDVSAMNRTMATTTISAIFSYRSMIDSCKLFYVPGRFKKAELSFSPIDQIGAVTPELSGFDSEPGLPVALILGLGYEYGTAVGIINQLEPQMTVCFRAIGHDRRFEAAVREANLDFDFGTYNVTVSEYELLDLQSAFAHIENIVHSMIGDYRVVMVPMGPKIFSALLVLVALRYFGHVAVWRVARPVEHPVSVEPDSTYVTASMDVGSPSVGIDLEQLRVMFSGEARF